MSCPTILDLRRLLREPLCLGLRKGREAETEGRADEPFEGARSEARKWLAGFFPLTEPRTADVGGMRRRPRRLLTRIGVLDGTGSEKQAQVQAQEQAQEQEQFCACLTAAEMSL